MSIITVTCMLIPALFSTPKVEGTVARTMAPHAVVREIFWAANQKRLPKSWAEAGIVGMTLAEVQQVCGPQTPGRLANNVCLDYVVGQIGGTTEYSAFIFRDGRVVDTYLWSATFVPAKGSESMGGILSKF